MTANAWPLCDCDWQQDGDGHRESCPVQNKVPDLLDALQKSFEDLPVHHYLTLCNDFDGWDYAECSCGWQSPPCPDVETAADFYGDHRAATERFPDA